MNETSNGWCHDGRACKAGTSETTHWIWKNQGMIGQPIYHILQVGRTPGAAAGGYFDREAALRAKGLVEAQP